MTRNGTPLQRLRDRQRISLPPERVEAIQMRKLEIQAEDAHETVVGNRAFEVVNVDGTDVAPFLGKTDGEKLVEPDGLDDGVVETPAIATEAITQHESDFDVSVVNCDSETPVVVATQAITLQAGEAAMLIGNCSILTAGGGSPFGEFITHVIIAVYRDGVEIAETVRAAASVIRGIGNFISATTAFTDEPGAGTFTYTLRAHVDDDTDVTTCDVSHRYLGVTRVRR